MQIRQLHGWAITPREAVTIQKRIREFVQIKKIPSPIKYVAGIDVSYSKYSALVWAGVAVFSYPDLKKVEEKGSNGECEFPYIPGMLSFREIPVVLTAIDQLQMEPDIILCDGQGIAHPRGLGLASHLGLVLDKPTIGCAKSRLVGDFSAVGPKKGDHTHLWYKDHPVGAVLRTRQHVKPLFISPGNAVTLEEALKIVLTCCAGYRLPEPIRQAHLMANKLRKRNTSF